MTQSEKVKAAIEEAYFQHLVKTAGQDWTEEETFMAGALAGITIALDELRIP